MIHYIFIPPTSISCLTTIYPLTGSFDIDRNVLVDEAEFYYPFEIISHRRTCDISLHNRTATAIISGVDSSGYVGNDIKVNPGADQIYYAKLLDTPNITGGFTISQFVKSSFYVNGVGPKGVETFRAIDPNDSNIKLLAEIQNDGTPKLTFSALDQDGFYRGYTTNFSSLTHINDDQWHHVAWTLSDDKQVLTCYVDGVTASLPVMPTSNYYPGGSSSNSITGSYTFTLSGSKTYHFDEYDSNASLMPPVWLDETGYWSRCLNSNEINSLRKFGDWQVKLTTGGTDLPTGIILSHTQYNVESLRVPQLPDNYDSLYFYCDDISSSGNVEISSHESGFPNFDSTDHEYYAFFNFKPLSADTYYNLVYPPGSITKYGVSNSSSNILQYHFIAQNMFIQFPEFVTAVGQFIPAPSPTSMNPVICLFECDNDIDQSTLISGNFTVTNGTISSFATDTKNHFWVSITPAGAGSITCAIASGVKTVFGFSVSSSTASITHT